VTLPPLPPADGYLFGPMRERLGRAYLAETVRVYAQQCLREQADTMLRLCSGPDRDGARIAIRNAIAELQGLKL
jgi:hypothetical protein